MSFPERVLKLLKEIIKIQNGIINEKIQSIKIGKWRQFLRKERTQDLDIEASFPTCVILGKSLKRVSLSFFTYKIPICDSGMRMPAWLLEVLWRSIEIIWRCLQTMSFRIPIETCFSHRDPVAGHFFRRD